MGYIRLYSKVIRGEVDDQISSIAGHCGTFFADFASG